MRDNAHFRRFALHAKTRCVATRGTIRRVLGARERVESGHVKMQATKGAAVALSSASRSRVGAGPERQPSLDQSRHSLEFNPAGNAPEYAGPSSKHAAAKSFFEEHTSYGVLLDGKKKKKKDGGCCG